MNHILNYHVRNFILPKAMTHMQIKKKKIQCLITENEKAKQADNMNAIVFDNFVIIEKKT